MFTYPLRPLCAAAIALTVASGGAMGPAHAAGVPESQATALDALPFEQLVTMRTVTAASKFEQLISEAPSAVVILTAADIKEFGWRSLGDALASLPGVYVTSDRNYSYLGARGFLRPGDYNSRFLLLVDGARVNDAVYDQAPLGSEGLVDMDMVQRIEFVPGPGSAVYGSNALFGVINVITKDGSDMHGARTAVASGSHGERKLRASWGWHGQNGADLVMSASVYGRDGANLYFPEYDTPEQNHGVAERLDYDRARNFLIKASYGGLVLSASHVHRTKGVPTGSFGAIFNTPNRTTDAQSVVNLGYARDFTPTLSLSAEALWGKADYLGVGDYPGETVPRVTNIDGDHARWYGASLHATYTGLRRHKILFGMDLQHDARRDQFNYDLAPYRILLDDRRTGQRSGVFFEDEIRLSGTMLLNLGLRHDRYEAGPRSTNPRAALLYKLSPADTAKLIYGTAFRVPNAYEMYYGPGDGSYQSGNLALAPERIRTHELVFEHALGTAGHATLSLFQYAMKDLITQETDETTGVLIFRNVARANASGFETAFERLLDGGARIRASYAWQRSRDGDGAALVNSPRHLAKLNLVAPLAARTHLGVELQCLSSRLTEHTRTGGYCVANLTLTAGKVLSGADLSLSLFNAGNKHYADPAGPAFIQEDLARQGRTLFAKLGYQF
ncbi:TonB-dependent receptor plug domain-containing protein [Massilia consociata]|uniref:TonB-dependent receptor plug domain-containing protein n=1 Tax=Massilia consociata TaxID=760117 RepID=A0ABV6FAY4_9BURK